MTQPTEDRLRESAFPLRVYLEKFQDGDRLALLLAAQAALWAVGADKLHAAFTKAMDRWRGGEALKLGEAFGIPDRRKRPAAEHDLVEDQGILWNRGLLIYTQVLDLRRQGKTRECAFAEAGRKHNLSAKKIEAVYDAARSLARDRLVQDPED